MRTLQAETSKAVPKSRNKGGAEAVAYRLMVRILAAEGMPLIDWEDGSLEQRSQRVLDCYAECLEATSGRRKLPEPGEHVRRGARRLNTEP